MSKTKNALAELSAYLAMYRDFHRDDDRVNDHILTKAQRIVAELAKVSDGRWEVICDGPPAYFCTAGDLKVQCAIGRCRAIAEEGVKDGK